jgi:hypothetical protein
VNRAIEVSLVNNAIALALGRNVTSDSVFFVQPHSQVSVEVRRLIVDGIVVGVQPLALLERHLVTKKNFFKVCQGWGANPKILVVLSHFFAKPVRLPPENMKYAPDKTDGHHHASK